MTDITYEIVEHDGGWAYKAQGVFSETFKTHDQALTAAKRVAAEQERPGDDTGIVYETADGKWHEELSDGEDRPHTHVKE